MNKLFSRSFTLLFALLILNNPSHVYAAATMTDDDAVVITDPSDPVIFNDPGETTIYYQKEVTIDESSKESDEISDEESDEESVKISDENSDEESIEESDEKSVKISNEKSTKKTTNKNKKPRKKKRIGLSKILDASNSANVIITRESDNDNSSTNDSTDNKVSSKTNYAESDKNSSNSSSNKKEKVSSKLKEKVDANYIKSNISKRPKKNKKGFISEKIFLPGHESTEMVCQGIAYLPNKVMDATKQPDGKFCRYVLLSYYPKHSSQPSQIVAVDRESGKAVRRFALYNSKSSKYDGHCGGIAVAGKYLWVASSYKIRAFDLQTIIDFILDKNAKADAAKGLPKSLDKLPVKKLVAVKSYGVDSVASYISFDGKYIWVGDFTKNDNSKYKAVSHHKVMGKKCWLAGYLVNEKGYPTSKTTYKFSGHKAHKPDAIIAMRQLVQGMAVVDNHIVLSLSFGAQNSKLAFYKNPLDSKGETLTYKAGGSHSVKAWKLSSKNHVKTVKLPAGSEDLEYDGENLYVTFECNSKNFRSRWGSKKGVKITEDFYLINPNKIIRKK